MSGERKWSGCVGCTLIDNIKHQNCRTSYGDEYEADGTERGCTYPGDIFPNTRCQYRCRHFQYTANIDDCCVGKAPPAKKSCNPSYTYRHDRCQEPLKKHCRDKMETALCKEWLNARPNDARQSMVEYCATRLNNETCRSFCRDPANTTACAAIVAKYCNANPTADFCACLKSDVKSKVGVSPKCINSDCVVSGYKPIDMLYDKCPDIINCEIQALINNSGISISPEFVIEQNCQSGEVDIIDSGEPTGEPTGEPIDELYIYLFIFIFVVLVVATGGYLFFKYFSRKESEAQTIATF